MRIEPQRPQRPQRKKRELVGDSFDAVFEGAHVEVDDQAQLAARDPEIADNLSGVDRGQLLHSFEFENDFPFDQEVDKLLSDLLTLVEDRNFELALKVDVAAFE